MRLSPSNRIPKPAAVKQGGYAEIEQTEGAGLAQRKSDQALGRKMDGRSKDANGSEPQLPADTTPGRVDHGS